MADAQGIMAEEAITMAEAESIAEEAVMPLAEENVENKDSLNKMDWDEISQNKDVMKMDCDENLESKDNLNKTGSKEKAQGTDKKDSKKEDDPKYKAQEALRREESKIKLKRFCFLGSFKPVFIHLRGYIMVNQLWPTVKELVKYIDDKDFGLLMQEVLHEVSVVRHDEALFVYAAYLASSVKMECKIAMRIAFPLLITTDNDLFLFCKYTSLINKQEKRKGLSRTVRRAIRAWYETQPVDNIRLMWRSHRGLHGFTHKVLMKLCHVSDDSIGSEEVASTFFKTCTELMKEAEAQEGAKNVAEPQANTKNAAEPQADDKNLVQSQAEAKSVVVPQVDARNLAEPQPDAKDVVEPQSDAKSAAESQADTKNVTEIEQATASSVSKTRRGKDKSEEQGKQELVKKSKVSPTPTSAIVAISKLRTTQKKHDAIKIIRKFKLSYSEVPGYWLRFPVIMDAVLPSMSYLQILKCWRKISRYNRFDKNSKIFKTCRKMLENVDFARKHSIHPVHILMGRHYIGKDALSKLSTKEVNAADYLDELYKNSLKWPAGSGKLRMHITLNLQSNYKKKLLKNHKKLTYYDACLALSLGYCNREEKVDVFYWSEDKLSVKEIPSAKNFTTEMGFNSVVNDKNNQRLIAPLMNAMTREQLYDVFLCIVPTAGRGNPKQKSELLCTFLDRYREKKNPNARFIILDLLKYNRPSMTYSSQRCENILEICGLDDHTTNLIHNFATHRFD